MYWSILYSLITATFPNYYLYFCTFPWGLLCFSDSLSMGGNNYSKLGAYDSYFPWNSFSSANMVYKASKFCYYCLWDSEKEDCIQREAFPTPLRNNYEVQFTFKICFANISLQSRISLFCLQFVHLQRRLSWQSSELPKYRPVKNTELTRRNKLVLFGHQLVC